MSLAIVFPYFISSGDCKKFCTDLSRLWCSSSAAWYLWKTAKIQRTRNRTVTVLFDDVWDKSWWIFEFPNVPWIIWKHCLWNELIIENYYSNCTFFSLLFSSHVHHNPIACSCFEKRIFFRCTHFKTSFTYLCHLLNSLTLFRFKRCPKNEIIFVLLPPVMLKECVSISGNMPVFFCF